MKLQNTFRTYAVAVGFAMFFLLTGTSRAQEIENTVWPDSNTVEAFPQPAQLATAIKVDSLATLSASVETATAVAEPAATEAAIFSAGNAKEGLLIGTSILLMSPAVVVVLSKVRRAKHNTNMRAYHNKRSTVLS